MDAIKRIFDVLASILALLALSPAMVVAAIGIRVGSPGPIIYRASRIGLNGRRFTMHKFRTMHVATSGVGSAITAPNDRRIFPFGSLLRKLKIDELPQLWDVIRGEMSIVGPRPEDPDIIDNHYTPLMHETLTVRPGLASPGSLFGTIYGDQYLDDDDPQGSYVKELLPIKLAVELVYVRSRSFGYDIAIILRTMTLIVKAALGIKTVGDTPELAAARDLLKANNRAMTEANALSESSQAVVSSHP